MKFIERFDWTNTLLIKNGKQAIEDILVDYHDIFARQKKNIKMTTVFEVQINPKGDKAECNRKPLMPIRLKGDLIVELALMRNY